MYAVTCIAHICLSLSDLMPVTHQPVTDTHVGSPHVTDPPNTRQVIHM